MTVLIHSVAQKESRSSNDRPHLRPITFFPLGRQFLTMNINFFFRFVR